MKQKRLSLILDDDLARALLAMSQDDCRTPTLEALWILREEAKRRNLVVGDHPLNHIDRKQKTQDEADGTS